MTWKRFEYFLNAILYCLWLREIDSDKFFEKIVYRLLSPIPKYLFTKKYRQKFYELQTKRKEEYNKLRYNKEFGFNIGWANHWFGYFYSCYPGYFVLVFLGLTLNHGIHFKGIVTIIVLAIPIGLFYIPAYKAVFSKDRYLRYFKKFEKEDAHWHKKWGRITTLFCIGAVAAALLGIVSMIAIAES